MYYQTADVRGEIIKGSETGCSTHADGFSLVRIWGHAVVKNQLLADKKSLKTSMAGA